MREKAELMVQRYGPILNGCLETAYARWIEKHRSELNIHRGRTRSSWVWDCAVDLLRSALATNRAFRFIDVHGTTYITYNQEFLIKVKKFDKSLRTSNIPTLASGRFNRQLPLGFEDELTHLYLGYVPDDLNMRIEQVHITCPMGNRVAWSILVAPDQPSQQPLDFPATHAAAVLPRKRIRPKTTEQRGPAVNGS